MEPVILEFVSCCRADGLRISTAEVLDCLAQLEMAGPLNEPIFHTILTANFAKSRREQAEFQRLYRLFFHEMKRGVPSDEDDDISDQGELSEMPHKASDLNRQLQWMTDIEGEMKTDLDQTLNTLCKHKADYGVVRSRIRELVKA